MSYVAFTFLCNECFSAICCSLHKWLVTVSLVVIRGLLSGCTALCVRLISLIIHLSPLSSSRVGRIRRPTADQSNTEQPLHNNVWTICVHSNRDLTFAPTSLLCCCDVTTCRTIVDRHRRHGYRRAQTSVSDTFCEHISFRDLSWPWSLTVLSNDDVGDAC